MLNYLLTCIVLILTSCQSEQIIYKNSFTQGRQVSITAIKQIKVGMSKNTVANIIGTPTLTGAFDENTWIYIFNKANINNSQSKLTLSFYNNKLISVSK